MTQLRCSTLLVVLWWWGDPKMTVEPNAACNPVQKALVKLVSQSVTSTVGEPNVTENGADEVTRCNVGGGGLDRRYQPHAAGQEIDVHL